MGIPNPLILGIESSCDETAAAIVEGGVHVRSNVVATQHALHEQYAGVVPEIASRAHVEKILPVIREALGQADIALDDLDAIAVGHRPGLIGSLLVGVSAAKALSWSLEIPLIGVDHIVAHLHACALGSSHVPFPALGLVVSGGHTSLYRLESPLETILLGRTIDDAAGEAFDKAAVILEAGYPGGPQIDRLACVSGANDRAHDFPVSQLGKHSLDFSFSGLKTSLLYAVRGVPGQAGERRPATSLSERARIDFAASFQRAVVRALTRNVQRALEQVSGEYKCLVVGGGVSANSRLREDLGHLAASFGIPLRMPEKRFCVDNAAMIAGYAHYLFCVGQFNDLALQAQTHSAAGSTEG